MEKPMPLPIELVLNIITCCLPAQGVLLSQSHTTTKLLLSFTRVCHETRRVAKRHLRDHCVYLDSSERLRLFLLELQTRPELRKVPAMFLSPFSETIDDLPTCSWVRELLSYTCDSLTKLVIDIPLRTCYPEDDHLGVRPVLRAGFERLVNLQEFGSVRDELYLDVTEYEYADVWMSWPKLKRLFLYNVDATEDFWRNVARHPSIETLALAMPDSILDVDPRAAYCRLTDRPLKLIIGRSSDMRYTIASIKERWDWVKSDPDRRMTIIVIRLLEWDYHPVYFEVAIQDGTLWECEGKSITQPEQMLRNRSERIVLAG